jgi:nitric oxide reductase subunit B
MARGNNFHTKGKNLAQWLLAKKTWVVQFMIVGAISIVGLVGLGMWTYTGAPPYSSFVSAGSGAAVIPLEQIMRGKEVFHDKGLMTWGSFWGDGAERGPEFTADALHRIVLSMEAFYANQVSAGRPLTQADEDAIAARVRREVHANGYDTNADVVRISDAQVYAYHQLETHYTRMFTDPAYPDRFSTPNYITDRDDLRALAAYFFWGGWASAANRPGTSYSYSQNWPYDPAAGNTPTVPTVLWSLLSILALFLGVMVVLLIYGQMKTLPGDPFNGTHRPTLTTPELESGREFVRSTQRATYKFFAFAIILFLIQVLVGILAAEDFVGGGPGTRVVHLFGLSIPFTVVRSLHLTLQIYWFFLCWIGYTIFFLPRLGPVPKGQRFLINTLFTLCVVVGAGALFGIYLGLTEHLSHAALYWLGTQGWEFMELGRFWHLLMLAAFVLWVWIIYRSVRQWLTRQHLWSVPAWLFYGSGIMVLFLFFGLMVTPRANFAISDYWRWMVVHMWVEVTFEVFTTVIVGYMLVQMGLFSRAMAERVIFLAVMMFLVTAVLGISHNFFWIGKPWPIIAIGSVFSTLQVLPLLLMTLDAWRLRREQLQAEAHLAAGQQQYLMDGVWLFILGCNFWNIFGAGVFGSLINLPIVNYFEHATYLTGNHAHAAMFGVKGNIALAGALFCCQHLFKRKSWNPRLIRAAFWSLNGGLALMMFLDLLPVGIYQTMVAFNHGLWYARSAAITTGPVFQFFTYARAIGGVVFLFGGVIPLVWFILSRGTQLVREVDMGEDETTVYDTDLAAEKAAGIEY